MIFNNKGASLIEASIAAAILGINALGYMHISDISANISKREKALDIVSDASRVIKKTLNNRASCALSLQGKSIAGDNTLTEIKTGDIDPNDFNAYIDLNQPALANQLDRDVLITGYDLVSINGKDHLQVSFDLDPTGTRDIGSSTVVRNFLLNGIKDPATNQFIDCYSEEVNLVKSVDNLNCINTLAGDFSDGTCQENPSKTLEDPEDVECQPGASYKLTEVNGQMKMRCTPCTPIKRFVRWRCQKGKLIGMKGVNWVNACYYRTGCQEDPIATIGLEYVIQGPTKASGGDTGREKSCKKKRKPCPGEEVLAQSAEDIAVSESFTALNASKSAKFFYNRVMNFANSGKIAEAKKAFSDLFENVNKTVRAAARSIDAADKMTEETKRSKDAKSRSIASKDSAEQYFNTAQDKLF